MDLIRELDVPADESDVGAAIADASTVVPTGAGTHREVGGPVPRGSEVRAPVGVVTYDPADLTVTVRAGTTVAELASVLGASAQECALDPRDPDATVGGTLAVGLSGHRRLRYGPLRDRVLEVRFATADGRIVRGGGPTVKNVTGYDLPRLLVGSFGTLGVLTRVILRCQPRPARAAWFGSEADPARVRGSVFRPSSVLWDGTTTSVLLEGNDADVTSQARAAALAPIDAPPAWPEGPHRGRVSVRPARLAAVAAALDAIAGCRWLAECGIGTVHVATDDEAALGRARDAASAAAGWLLREAGAPGLDGFGTPLPSGALAARVKAAFDPDEKLAPGRLPFA